MKTLNNFLHHSKLSQIFILVFLPLLACLSCLIFHPNSYAREQSAKAEDYLAKGHQAYQHGQFEQAVGHLAKAADLFLARGDDKNQGEALIQEARAYKATGRSEEALVVLEKAMILARQEQERRLG